LPLITCFAYLQDAPLAFLLPKLPQNASPLPRSDGVQCGGDASAGINGLSGMNLQCGLLFFYSAYMLLDFKIKKDISTFLS